MRRILGTAGLVLVGTATVVLVMLAPDLEWILPGPFRRRRFETALLVLVAAYAVARGALMRARSRGIEWPGLSRWLRGADAIGGIALRGGLSIVFGGICLAYLATWMPHYLLWPWGRDADTFATLAQSWEAGIRPYRDIRGYNFPGAIYFFWILGKVFGWGRTWPLYAVDSAGLVLLGVVLAAWSRRCLGGMLPGLASYLLFVTYYLSHYYQIVAQRDWHTALCVAIGLLFLQGWSGRAPRIVAAGLVAAALSIRPHAVVFLPALASAILEGAVQVDPRPDAAARRRLAGWFLLAGLFTAAAFLPVIVAGIADDLVRGLRVASYGGPYSRASFATAARVLRDESAQPGIGVAVTLLAVVIVATRGGPRRRAVTWALALGAALIYRLPHPVQHHYLDYPSNLIGAIALAPSLGWLVDRVGVAAPIRALAVVILVAESNLGLPTFCNVKGTLEALATMARGQDIPMEAPPGTGGWFEAQRARRYDWTDYRAALIYLRTTTSPTARVANVLQVSPFPSINGPIGRLSPFLAESGVCWMWLVPIDLEPEFAEVLRRDTSCIVVWSPGEDELEPGLHLRRMSAVIRENYRPEARFGRIEVWRRADDAGGAGARGIARSR